MDVVGFILKIENEAQLLRWMPSPSGAIALSRLQGEGELSMALGEDAKRILIRLCGKP